MAEAGAVSWQFTRKGYISVEGVADQDEFFLVAAEGGAEDVLFNEEGAEVYADLDSFHTVQKAIEDAGYTLSEASIIYDPHNPVDLEQEDALQVMNLVEKLEELDDVQNVFSSLNITEETLAAMAA